MSMNAVMDYIQQYGYIIIFVFLFFGIVGIPAPEESLIFFIGVLIAQDKLTGVLAVLCAIGGAFTGMMTAYVGGRFIGYPLLNKFGKYIGVTTERWEKAEHKYRENVNKTIIFGFYMPGIRQISPYFAGIANVGMPRFIVLSFLGAVVWVMPFILAGYFIGRSFNVNPEYVPYLGLLFLVIFISYFFVKWIRSKRSKRKNLKD